MNVNINRKNIDVKQCMRIAPKLALVAYVHSTQSGGETGEDAGRLSRFCMKLIVA